MIVGKDGDYMSMPNIPEVKDSINLKRDQVINLLLASVGFEELGLAHILNAEGEKIQAVINNNKCDVDDLLKINESVRKTLQEVIKKEMLLQFKLEDILQVCDTKE